MFGFGFMELLLILVVVLFFIGGRKLPQIGDGLGRCITEFKRAVRSPSSPSPTQDISSKQKEGGKGTP